MTTPKSLRGWLVTLALTTGVNCGGSDATAFSRGQGGKTGDASAAGGSEAGGSSGSSTGGAATGGSSTGSGGTSGGSGGRSSGDGGAVDGGGTGGGSDVGDASPTGDSAAEAGTCSNPTTFFADTDDDKFGDPLTTIKACGKPPGYVENSDDCYDDNASAKPGQTGWFKVDRGDGSYDSTATSRRPSTGRLRVAAAPSPSASSPRVGR